jgi:hypothetical protein
VSTRTFASASELVDGRLALGLARARTPEGDISSPSFFHGFATHPRSVAQGLITLADITATRYFRAAPTTLRDPVLTAHGDRLRAEVFSADNGVYARLDLAGDALDGGDIARGTTNVDIGDEMRRALALVTNGELLHLDVGSTGLSAATPHAQTSNAGSTSRPLTHVPSWRRCRPRPRPPATAGSRPGPPASGCPSGRMASASPASTGSPR